MNSLSKKLSGAVFIMIFFNSESDYSIGNRHGHFLQNCGMFFKCKIENYRGDQGKFSDFLQFYFCTFVFYLI